ncbi:LOW QUALITY PROTEIN: organic cation/carnitine transporter 4-like [Dioscorea cayenensis subsp. rotundata]|uniref:H(+)/Pi cotransporter n=1 Tax=Dioscorea cayennensis subsp. rotundata TaxID=55577 RepID=A0AB40BW94_DIOCR|nr:LOW QUALITY PROTEIN: organic cation/carnitine transporter 4-like [Dioscorea cayenensis subsp. rotundata]
MNSKAADPEAQGGGGDGDDLRVGLLKSNGDGNKLVIDEMLRRHAGEMGRWQMRHFLLTTLAWSLEAFHTMVMIFADREPAWRCSGLGFCPPDPCGLGPGDWGWIDGSGVSTVAEWGLVCGEKYKVGLVQSAFFLGCMIGAGLFGHLSDSFLGHKGSLTAVCILNTIFGLLTSMSPNYWVYFILRLLTGFSTGGVGLCAFVLATEPIGPSKRAIAGMSTFYFFSGGIALLSGTAYIFKSWRTLYIATSLPSLLFLFAIIPFISESPRWYLVRRRINDAMSVMRAIAQTNGKHIPDGVTLILDDDNDDDVCDEKLEPSNQTQAISGSLVDVIRSPITRNRLFLSIAINFLTSVVYYGLSLNVVNLKTNLYLSVFLNAVSEMPAFLLTALLLNWLGRKPLCASTMFLSGVSCVIGSLLSNSGTMKVPRLVCGLIGIFGMAATYNLLFIYTSELFPTVVRSAALGGASQAAQMGAILAPMVVVLGDTIPFVVFGFCGVLGGLLAFLLPETMNKPLYDTIGGLVEGEKSEE